MIESTAWLRRMGRPLKRLLVADSNGTQEPPKADVWSISIYRGRSPFELSPDPDILHPALTAASVSDMPAAYVADPFLAWRGDTWHMYFEVLPEDRRGNGVIGHATSSDGKDWRYDRIVLSESFHLSYPYVFQWKDEWFMVPESYQANAIRLYRATGVPESWVFERNLVEGGEFVDSSPFYFGDRWWMFACTGMPPLRSDTLRLFSANELTGPWREHPESPIVQADMHIARPAGRVLVSGGRLYRFAQDCSPAYGFLVRAFEITELSGTSYGERLVRERPILEGSGSGWNAEGMHHIDAHRAADGQWMASVDGWCLS